MSMDKPSFIYPSLESGEIRLLTPQFDDSRKLTWELKSVPLLNNKGKGKAAIPNDYDAL